MALSSGVYVSALLLLSLAAQAVQAAPDGSGQQPASADPELAAPNAVLETARSEVRAATVWLARSVDGWFGDRPFEEGGRVSDGRISLALLKRQDRSIDYALRFNVRLRLPNAEKYAYVFIGRDDQRDVVTDTPAAFSQQQRLLRDRAEAPSFIAGLGLNLPHSFDARIGFRGGLKPYAQVRYSQSWTAGSGLRTDFRETLFWAQDDRLGLSTALSLEQPLSAGLAVRLLNAVTVTQNAPKLDWSASLGAYQALGAQRLLSLEALLHAVQGSGVGLSDYGVQVTWEQPVYRQWLLGEVLVGHFWPRADPSVPRTKAWALGGSLKMSF